MNALADRLAGLPDPDVDARDAVSARAAQVLRPAGALARFDEVAAWLAGWQRTTTPAVRRPAALVFAADHGVAASAPVSAYETSITAAMVSAFDREVATMSALCRRVGATVDVVDVGVGRPTGDLRHEPALDPDRFDEVVEQAFGAVDRLDTDLLVVGELGIGNTTAAAAVAAALSGGDVAGWVGRGTGVSDEALAVKVQAVSDGVERIRREGVDDPIETLRQVGGAELVAMAAAVVAARHRSIPVVLDGYISTASVFPLHVAAPGALDHCLPGHRSAEPGHGRLLDAAELRPLLELDLRLGEGSGAMAAVPLVDLACASVVDVATFDEFFAE
ncbi:MAG: nicotinate-nucleotide--dimethylbenzimidazole phosphoribosyltransferase [Actinomycetota bacterium]